MAVELPTIYEDVTPETCLRIMDQAMYDWLASMRCREQYAKVVTGWQSRQFTQTHLVHDGKPVKQAIPLPVVTLTQTMLKTDPNRWTRSPVMNLSPGPTSRTNKMYYGDYVASTDSPWTGTGALLVFDNATLSNVPVLPGSVVLIFTRGGTVHTESDNALGAFTNTSTHIASSFIDYTTGAVRVTFSDAPDNNTPITFRYGSNRNDAVLNCPFPLPVTISYQIDLWTKTQQDMRSLRTSLLLRFGNVHPTMTYLKATFPYYGQKVLFLELGQDTDNSELETDEVDRELRHTITVDMHGWIFQEPYLVKTIKHAHAVVIAAGGGPPPACELNDTAFLAWYDDAAHYHLNSDGSRITSVDESTVYTPPNKVILILTFDEGKLTAVGP